MKDAITNKKTIKTARIAAVLKVTNRSWKDGDGPFDA
jgi:hypothetical protein